MQKTISAIRKKRHSAEKNQSAGKLLSVKPKTPEHMRDRTQSNAKLIVSLVITVLIFLCWFYMAAVVILVGSLDSSKIGGESEISAFILTLGFPVAILSSIFLYIDYLRQSRSPILSPNLLLASVLFGSIFSYFGLPFMSLEKLWFIELTDTILTFSTIALVYTVLAVIKLILMRLEGTVHRR